MTERFPVRNVVIAVLFLVIVIWAGNQLVAYLADQGTEPVPEEPAPITQPVEEDKSPVEEEEEEEEETPAPPAEGLEMDIRTLQDQECWLEVIVDGNKNIQDLWPGERKKII